jgi:hypothetical protein
MANERRDFVDVLTDLDDGHVHEELTAKLHEVVQAVIKSRQAGALTLKISVRLEGERQLVVNAKVTPTIPAAKPGFTMFFHDEAGGLRKDDPRQIPMRYVATPPQPLRTVDKSDKGA